MIFSNLKDPNANFILLAIHFGDRGVFVSPGAPVLLIQGKRTRGGPHGGPGRGKFTLISSCDVNIGHNDFKDDRTNFQALTREC